MFQLVDTARLTRMQILICKKGLQRIHYICVS